jgi:excisionase family DNA binding protein
MLLRPQADLKRFGRAKRDTTFMATQTEARLLVTATEAARLLGCSAQTVKRLAERGDLRTVRFGPNGHVRFRLREIEEFVEKDEED